MIVQTVQSSCRNNTHDYVMLAKAGRAFYLGLLALRLTRQTRIWGGLYTSNSCQHQAN